MTMKNPLPGEPTGNVVRNCYLCTVRVVYPPDRIPVCDRCRSELAGLPAKDRMEISTKVMELWQRAPTSEAARTLAEKFIGMCEHVLSERESQDWYGKGGRN